MQKRKLKKKDVPAENWLQCVIEESIEAEEKTLSIPLRSDGSDYSIDFLYDEQKFISLVVLKKIQEWYECTDFSTFEPLRMIVNGQGGTGKSVLLNTISASIRTIFHYTNTCNTTAPTGVSAFNVNGKTLQAFSAQKRMRGEYQAGSMSPRDRKFLAHQLKHLLCLIIDERSMVTSKVLGTTECRVSETIYQGRGSDSISWGGLPVVIMAGDDYQLPGIHQGAFDVFERRDGGKMTERGRRCFIECAEVVYQLKQIRRIADKNERDRQLLGRLRIGEHVTLADVHKLQSLHLDKIKEKHGQSVVDDIKQRAIELFWTNDKRIRTNLQKLSQLNSEQNPTAIVKPRTSSVKFAKGVAKHFGEDIPGTAMLCVGAKVAIVGKNFKPNWGLHNGACGIVQEIIFGKNDSPNNGCLPKYVVVEFPLYTGPVWDEENPLVREKL